MWVGWEGYKAYMESIGKTVGDIKEYSVVLDNKTIMELKKENFWYEIPDNHAFLGEDVVKIPIKE